MPAFLANPKTTFMAALPFVAYGLKAMGWWPESIPLPPLDQAWPALLAVFGVGMVAADGNKG